MKQRNFKILITAIFAVAMMTGCTKKLDLKPTNDLTADDVYKTAAGYKQALAKVYGAMALTGNAGGAGSPDIPPQIISDEGNSDFLRMYWYLQCLSTDEAGWTYHNNTDPIGIHQMTWSSINQTVGGLYYRCFFLITLANDFIRQCSDDNLSKRGISGADATNIKLYMQEARFLRAYMYWVLMDMFANPPFVTENDAIGVGLPKQTNRAELFAYLETELKDLETKLKDSKTNEYGRADKAAAWSRRSIGC